MILRWCSVAVFLATLFRPAFDANASPGAVDLPALPHTVGMAGPDVALIESGIAAYERGDLQGAATDFRKALAIRDRTAVANFNLGVVEVRLGDRTAGAAAMRRGFALARDHGMAASPQAASMREIADALHVTLAGGP